jgi:hypothetical protein
LNKRSLAETKTSLVGDVVDVVVCLGVLTVGTSDLDVEFVSDSLELSFLFSELGQVNMNRCSEASTAVSGACSDVAEMSVILELEGAFKGSRPSDKSLEDLEERSSLLHRNDSELVLFINPHEEGLALVVENTSA